MVREMNKAEKMKNEKLKKEKGRKERKRKCERAVQMDNLRGLLGIRRMDRVPNARIREL